MPLCACKSVFGIRWENGKELLISKNFCVENLNGILFAGEKFVDFAVIWQ
jgi:hypothetical protein